MLRHIAISTLVLGTGLSLGACGSSDEKGPAEDWFSSYVSQLCRNTDTCCKAAGEPSSQNACRQFLNFFAAGSVSQASYDAAAGKQCLAELAAQEGKCEEASPLICDLVLTGKSPKGGACVTNFDCAAPPNGRASCVYGLDDNTTCQHELPAAEGVPCGFGNDDGDEVYECTQNPDFYCDSADVCRMRVASGEPCAGDTCMPGAYCDDQAVCSPRTPLDSACSSSSECVKGAYCDQTCKPMKQAGEPCTVSDECKSFCNGGVCESGGSGFLLCFTDD